MDTRFDIDELVLPSHLRTSSQRTTDIWSTIYMATSIFNFGYRLLRPSQGNWGGAIEDIARKMNDLDNRIQIITGAINDIQRAISEMPSVMNKVVETKLAEDNLYRAQAILENLAPLAESEYALESNADLIVDRCLKVFDHATVFEKWYRKHENGHVSYLVNLAPILGQTFAMYDYAQVKRWELRNPTFSAGDYPFDKIPNHKSFPIRKRLLNAYSSIIEHTQNTKALHQEGASRTFPNTHLNVSEIASNTKRIYSFDGKEFSFVRTVSDQDLKIPLAKNHLKYSGRWWEKGESDDPNESLVVWLLEYGYQGNGQLSASISSSMSRPATDPEKLLQAKKLATEIARDQFYMEKIKIIDQELDGHIDTMDIIKTNQVWGQ